jgi:hypothetical protein
MEIVGGIEVRMYYNFMSNLYYVPPFSDNKNPDFALGFCPPSQSKRRVGRSLTQAAEPLATEYGLVLSGVVW